jgi:hypothetical protein
MPPKAAPAEGRPEGADAPINQSREAHHPARPLHSPEGAEFWQPAGRMTAGACRETHLSDSPARLVPWWLEAVGPHRCGVVAGVGKVSALQLSALQVGATQVRPPQVRPSQVGVLQVSPEEIPADVAYQRMRSAARSSRRPVAEVAQIVVDGGPWGLPRKDS